MAAGLEEGIRHRIRNWTVSTNPDKIIYIFSGAFRESRLCPLLKQIYVFLETKNDIQIMETFIDNFFILLDF